MPPAAAKVKKAPRSVREGAAAAALEGVLSAGRAVFGSGGGGGGALLDDLRASRAKGALARTRGGLRLLFPAYDLGVGCSSVEGAAVLDEDKEEKKKSEDDDADADDDDRGERRQKEKPSSSSSSASSSSASWFPPDTPDPPPDAPYVPSTVPGSRMPHAWLRTAAATAAAASVPQAATPPWLELPAAAAAASSSSSSAHPRLLRLSTLDLPPAREPSCVLVVRAGNDPPSSSPWARAFLELARGGGGGGAGGGEGGEEEGTLSSLLPLRLAVVAPSDAAAGAARAWLRALDPAVAEQVAFLVDDEEEEEGGGDEFWRSGGGAVLVRPDGVVGWRARTTTTDKGGETGACSSFSLLRALRRVYGFAGEPGDAPLPPWER